MSVLVCIQLKYWITWWVKLPECRGDTGISSDLTNFPSGMSENSTFAKDIQDFLLVLSKTLAREFSPVQFISKSLFVLRIFLK